jgi:hypothetical protein
VQIHGASAFVDGPGDITVDLNAHDPEFVFVRVGFPGGVYMTVYGDAEADMVITKFLQAKDMLAAHRHAVACHAGIGEYVNGTVAENTAPKRVKLCRCDRDPRSHVPMASCPEWKDAKGLPVAEDDGGDGDDQREPYCIVCLFTLDAAGDHMYPLDAIIQVHDTEVGWREPVGREPTGDEARAVLQAEVDAAVQARKNGLA